MKKEFKILSPTAILGYGYPLESFARGMARNPDLIAVDAGSVDPGPYYLGSGKSFTDRAGVKRDLRFMLKEGIPRNIPIVIGTAGGSGARPHVDWCKDIIEEIAKEEGLSFKMGVIYADISDERIFQAIDKGETRPLGGLDNLTKDNVEKCNAIVGQMGIEPICDALEQECQVILAGRAYDPTVFAALPIMKGFDAGLALHLGKILECAAIAAEPGSGSDSALGILTEDSFILEPLNDKRKFTKTSVPAHTLYEKSDPYHLPGPSGELDLTNVVFSEIGNGRVEVKGSKFVPEKAKTIKLEGTEKVGCRTISVAGIRDSIMIAGIDKIIEDVNKQVKDILKTENIEGKGIFHIYGKNGVMEQLEPLKNPVPHELGIVIEGIAKDQKTASSICSITRSSLLHFGYEGRVATAGNLAFPFSPSDFSAGDIYEFKIYHLIELHENEKLFPVKIENVVN